MSIYAQAPLQLSQGGVHCGTGTGTSKVLCIQRCQSVQGRDCCEDREEVEGSLCGPTSRDSTELSLEQWRKAEPDLGA